MSTKNNTFINDLTTGDVKKKLFTFALPFMLAMLIQNLYGLVDMIVIGHSEIGSIGMSAISTGSLLTQLSTNFVMGFTSGGQIVLSQLVGLKNQKDLNKTIGNLFTLTLLFGLFFGVISIIFANPLLNLVNTPEAAYEQTKSYLIICSIGMMFIFGYNAVSAVLRGLGDSRRPLIFISISCVINIVLDILLISIFNLQSTGAAIATVISQASSFVIAIFYLYKKREELGFDFKPNNFMLDSSTVKVLMKIGFPQGFQQSTVILSFMFVNSQVNTYGTTAGAVTGVGLKLSSLVGIFTNSLSAAGSNMIGQNLAANKIDRIKKTMNNIIVFSVLFTTCFSILALLFPEAFFSIFNDEPAVLEMAKQYMPYGVVAFFAFATMTYTAVCHGVGNARLSLIIGLMDGVVARIGLSYLFGTVMKMGLPGYWLGNGAAGYVSAIMGAIYYYSNAWVNRKPVVK